jgi:tRNA 2-selenouridine synthase
MRRSPVYFLNIPFEERLKHITAEYGELDKEKLINAITRIQQRLGGLEAKNAIRFLLDNNTIESFRILLKYYDKWYLKSLHNRENVNSLLTEISCQKVDVVNTNILLQQALTI